MQNNLDLSSKAFFNFNHWPSFIANKKQVWISKAYNFKAGILNQSNLQSNSIFYPLSVRLNENEEIIQTSGGLFNFYYLTNQGRIFQIAQSTQQKKTVFLPLALPRDLQDQEKITQIIIKETACILISNQQNIYVSGQNKYGELGFIPNKTINHLTRVPLQLKEDETIIKFVTSNKDYLDNQKTSIHSHSAFFTNHNRLFVCGSNFLNELGLQGCLTSPEFTQSTLDFSDDSILDIAVSNRATFILTAKGKLWVSGSYIYGFNNNHLYTNHSFKAISLPNLNPDEKLIQVSAGTEHCVLLSDKGRLLVSGKNSCGELGLGHHQSQFGFSFAKPLLFKNEKITQVTCIGHQTVIHTNADRLLFSGKFNDFTNPTLCKQSLTFKTLFFPKEIYQSQLKISRILLCLSIASYTGAIFTSHILHIAFLVAGTSLLLPALYIYLLSKHNEVLYRCEENQLNEINQIIGLKH